MTMDDKQREQDREARAAAGTKEAIRAIHVTINAMEAAGIEPLYALAGLAMLIGRLARTEGVKLDHLVTLITRHWELNAEEPPP
jgi:hypothetical protein